MGTKEIDGLPSDQAQGGTLKFSVYIGEADFLGVKILNFRILGGFQKNLLFFRVVSFLWIFFVTIFALSAGSQL